MTTTGTTLDRPVLEAPDDSLRQRARSLLGSIRGAHSPRLSRRSVPSVPQSHIPTESLARIKAKAILGPTKFDNFTSEQQTELERLTGIFDQQLGNFKPVRLMASNLTRNGQKIGTTAEVLMEKTAEAIKTLTTGFSKELQLSLSFSEVFFVTKQDNGELHIARRVQELGSGSSGIAWLCDIITGVGTAVAKIARADNPEASNHLLHEIDMLNFIHADGIVPHVQLPPLYTLRLLNNADASSSTASQQSMAIGFMGPYYEKNGHAIATAKEMQNPERATACVRQLFTGLAGLFSRNVVHGDIKSSNIMSINGMLYICDLEGAKVMVPGITVEEIAENVYTTDYMHPSDATRTGQLKSTHSEDLDAYREAMVELLRARDVYSLCATCYEMIIGRKYLSQEMGTWTTILKSAKATKIPVYSKENLAQHTFDETRLLLCGLPQHTVDLLKRGLDADYRLRPKVEEFLL